MSLTYHALSTRNGDSFGFNHKDLSWEGIVIREDGQMRLEKLSGSAAYNACLKSQHNPIMETTTTGAVAFPVGYAGGGASSIDGSGQSKKKKKKKKKKKSPDQVLFGDTDETKSESFLGRIDRAINEMEDATEEEPAQRLDKKDIAVVAKELSSNDAANERRSKEQNKRALAVTPELEQNPKRLN